MLVAANEEAIRNRDGRGDDPLIHFVLRQKFEFVRLDSRDERSAIFANGVEIAPGNQW